MRKLFLTLVGISFGLGCSSSSSNNDDLGPNPNAAVIDDVQAPASVPETITSKGSGWNIPLTVSFHDDHENVNRITFSAQLADSQTFVLPVPTNKQVDVQYSLTLYAPTGSTDGGGAGIGYKPGTYSYSIAAVSESGIYSTPFEKTITLQ